MASRQYGLILGLIDALPRTSKTKARMEDDPEYVEMVREAFLNDDESDDVPEGPSISQWSEGLEISANVIDEIRLLRATVAAANGGNEKPKPYTRPRTLMMEASESARLSKRRLKHEALVNKLVPKKE